ncbi:NADPH oxidase organizer 1-like [Lampris incognitus]|uniref:NADPH oxidase organizer 1-like n=1 Tax=Lampris incognitus TaxID=2546036 RepID=UPI0024B5286E|nr:NADPH oxidase organizer 1-like [Lampris incognitus]
MVDRQRSARGVRVIGVMYRDAPEVKMFLLSVVWSDDSEMVVYRSFQDFKRFHRQLKKKFSLRKDERMIPKFKGGAMRSSLQQKGSSRSVRRMRFLERYCCDLMRCDLTVTQSSEVTHFFMPKEHDLQPDFTKNSIMIMPSGDAPDAPDGGAGSSRAVGNVTQPFVTQMYRCVAAYETKDTKNRPFKVGLAEKLDVLIKDPAGWWLVENEDKCLAWFPAPYLEMCEEEEEEEDDDDVLAEGGLLYCAVRNYVTKKHDELPLAIGSVVKVLRKSDNGWWLIRFNGKAGYVPSMYLKPYSNPQAGLHSLQRMMHCSTLNLEALSSAHGSSFDFPARAHQAGDPDPSPAQGRHESHMVPKLYKTHSLDVLSETQSNAVFPNREQRVVSNPNSRKSSVSTASTLSSFSSRSSSSSESSTRAEENSSDNRTSSPRVENADSGHSSLDLSLSTIHLRSNSAADSSGSDGPESGLTVSVVPRVPPRPKAQEILTRCSTMTRKAAVASRIRLLPQQETIQSR